MHVLRTKLQHASNGFAIFIGFKVFFRLFEGVNRSSVLFDTFFPKVLLFPDSCFSTSRLNAAQLLLETIEVIAGLYRSFLKQNGFFWVGLCSEIWQWKLNLFISSETFAVFFLPVDDFCDKEWVGCVYC